MAQDTLEVDVIEVGADDLHLLRSMNKLFGEAFEDHQRYIAAPPSDGHLQRLLQTGTFIALVAMGNGEPVGALAGYELIKFERATSELYIYDLAVAAEHRRRGIGSALIDRLRQIARDRNAETIFVQADGDDPPAIALYEKYGSREEVCHFDVPPA